MKLTVSGLIGGLLAWGMYGECRAQSNSPELKHAATTYMEAAERQRTLMLKNFDLALGQLQRRSGDVNQRLKLIEVVNAERRRFESDGLVPWSEPMRPYLEGYLKNMATAVEGLSRAYDTALNRALKAGDAAQTNQLKAEMQAILKVKPVAVWKQTIGGGKKWNTNRLFINGKLNQWDAAASWNYHGKQLQLVWPAKNAPGGAWRDTVEIGPNGHEYQGSNQNGVKLKGVYVHP